MAVIQKIRNQYGKIAGAVIAVSLISFIVSDALNGSLGSMFSSRETYVVSVDGTKVESKDYEKRVKEYEILTSIYSNRGPIDEATRAQIREQVLAAVTYEAMAEKMCDKLGITTSKQEKDDLIYSMNAHPLVRQFNIEGQQVFNNDQTKQFDPTRVKGLEEELKKNPKIDPYGKITENWTAVKEYVIRNSRIDKFNNMMGGSVYLPKYLATKGATEATSMASIRYVKVPYTAIPDNDIKVTDDDINKYIQTHKGLFKIDEPFRALEYVSFDIIPASADSMRAFGALVEISDEFSKAKDIPTYVGNKTDDINTYSQVYTSKKNLQSMYADTMMQMPVGTIFGPYFENNSFKITRITDKKTLADSVKIRHILIRVKERDQVVIDDSTAKKRIDSVVAAIKGGANFDSMVIKYSDDQGSKANHGEYWFTLAQRPGIDTNFGNFSFEGRVGETKIVKGENPNYTGYHYVEILEQKGVEPTIQMATISKNLIPSDSTVNAIYSRANDFAAAGTSATEFDNNAKKQGYDKRIADNIKENSFGIQGIGNSRDVIKWAFEHKVGEVTTVPFNVNDQRYVVCKLTAITDKGVIVLNAANKPMLEQKVKEEKKAAAITAKYKGASLESIAQTTSQQVIQNDSVTLGGGYVPNLGYEPKIVGYAFNPSFQPNTVSPGLKGQGGVYFISVLSKNTRPINPMEQQMAMMQQKNNMEMQLKNYFGQVMQASMVKTAKIKYNLEAF